MSDSGLPQLAFDKLLLAHADLSYSLFGSIPEREWKERRELVLTRVPARQIAELYPSASVKNHLLTRLLAFARADVELLPTLTYATRPDRHARLKSALLRHRGDAVGQQPWRWDVPVDENRLLIWIRTGAASDPSLVESKIGQMQRTLAQLMWAFENPYVFSWKEQLAIIESLDTFFDLLSTHSLVRTQAFYEAPALKLYHTSLSNQLPLPNQSLRSFPVQTRADRLAELWDQEYATDEG